MEGQEPHFTHKFVADGSSGAPAWWEKTHCNYCSLDIEDERILQPCIEEPWTDPYSEPEAWEAGFADNH